MFQICVWFWVYSEVTVRLHPSWLVVVRFKKEWVNCWSCRECANNSLCLWVCVSVSECMPPPLLLLYVLHGPCRRGGLTLYFLVLIETYKVPLCNPTAQHCSTVWHKDTPMSLCLCLCECVCESVCESVSHSSEQSFSSFLYTVL